MDEDASRDTWLAEVSEALGRCCEADCVTRGAILDAIEGGIIATPRPQGGWLARKEGDALALYALAGRALTSAKGRCIHHQAGALHGGAAEATVDVSRVPFRDDARVECRIVRTERNDDGRLERERSFRWRFGSGGTDLLVDITPDSPDPARQADSTQGQRFVAAVADALAEPPPPPARH